MVLADGKEYTFSEVGIGFYRRRAMAFKSAGEDAWARVDANLDLILESLKTYHPDLTREILADKLITLANSSAAIEAVDKACGIYKGEVSPAAVKTDGTGSTVA